MITGYTKVIAELTSKEKDKMYELLSGHFLGTSREVFEHDLSEKECVFLLAKKTDGEVVGFSTITHFNVAIDERDVSVVFSGDTVVLEQYRSNIRSVAEIARYFQSIHNRHPDREVYYVLSSKGWRTYRLLPCFFKEFYPNHKSATPSQTKKILDAFCTMKFPEYYDPARGLLTATNDRQRLRPEKDSDSVLPDRNNSHINFFAEKNPCFLDGDELVCIASIALSNLTSSLLRFTRGRSTSLSEETCDVETAHRRR